MKIGDLVEVKGGSGRVFRIIRFEGWSARLIPKDPKDKGELLEPLDNLRKAK